MNKNIFRTHVMYSITRSEGVHILFTFIILKEWIWQDLIESDFVRWWIFPCSPYDVDIIVRDINSLLWYLILYTSVSWITFHIGVTKCEIFPCDCDTILSCKYPEGWRFSGILVLVDTSVRVNNDFPNVRIFFYTFGDLHEYLWIQKLLSYQRPLTRDSSLLSWF